MFNMQKMRSVLSDIDRAWKTAQQANSKRIDYENQQDRLQTVMAKITDLMAEYGTSNIEIDLRGNQRYYLTPDTDPAMDLIYAEGDRGWVNLSAVLRGECYEWRTDTPPEACS